MKHRRVLRKAYDERQELYEMVPFVAPVVTTYVKEKASPFGTILFFFGALLLLIADAIQALSWLSKKLPLMPITVPPEFIAWCPIIFAIGILLSIVGIIIKATSGKIITFIFLVLIYAAFALGLIDMLFGWMGII
ncbi:MAG: hypothetical protein QW692_00125 [Nitrososphaerota archaeon]